MGLLGFRKKNKYVKKVVTYEYELPVFKMNIIKESLDIMAKTTNPDTYFSRYRLADKHSLYCIDEPDIIWNGMNCKQIYDMLNGDVSSERLHRQFIDRLFKANREDWLTYKLYEHTSDMSVDSLNYFVKKLNHKKYHFCKVRFSDSNRLYTYITKDKSVKIGDSVTVPTGNLNFPDSKLLQVVEVFDAALDDLDFDLDRLRCVEGKLKTINCPNCGASIEVDVGEKTGKCKYCGSMFYLVQ